MSIAGSQQDENYNCRYEGLDCHFLINANDLAKKRGDFEVRFCPPVTS